MSLNVFSFIMSSIPASMLRLRIYITNFCMCMIQTAYFEAVFDDIQTYVCPRVFLEILTAYVDSYQDF